MQHKTDLQGWRKVHLIGCGHLNDWILPTVWLQTVIHTERVSYLNSIFFLKWLIGTHYYNDIHQPHQPSGILSDCLDLWLVAIRLHRAFSLILGDVLILLVSFLICLLGLPILQQTSNYTENPLVHRKPSDQCIYSNFKDIGRHNSTQFLVRT